MKIECIEKMRKLQAEVEELKRMVKRLVKQLYRKANIRIDIEEDI